MYVLMSGLDRIHVLTLYFLQRIAYPFHIEHKSNGQAYSLYVDTIPSRKEWLSKLKDQITIRKVTSENNAVSASKVR